MNSLRIIAAALLTLGVSACDRADQAAMPMTHPTVRPGAENTHGVDKGARTIVPGDTLQIGIDDLVKPKSIWTKNVKVDADGKARVPAQKLEVQVAGLTEDAAAADIGKAAGHTAVVSNLGS